MMTRAGTSGYTLAEVLVALAVSAIVLVSAGMALRTSLDAEGRVQAESSALSLARFALSRMATRLANATSLSVAEPAAVEVTVALAPDAAETSTIRYQWSGAAGGELTETVDGGTPVALVPHVAALTFSYLTDAETSITAGERRQTVTEDVTNVVRIALTVSEEGSSKTLHREVKMRNL